MNWYNIKFYSFHIAAKLNNICNFKTIYCIRCDFDNLVSLLQLRYLLYKAILKQLFKKLIVYRF